MKEKIISKAKEMFLKLGFKSITMDDIAGEMCISKKTIYKYFANKELLIEESVQIIHKEVRQLIEEVTSKNYNAIEENFQIRRMFDDMFKSSETSPIYQLKKHYPEVYKNALKFQVDECEFCFRQNIEKGIAQGLYRESLNIESYIKFYYYLIFSINENTPSEREAYSLEFDALEYHTRAMATEKGITELEKNLLNPIT
ncbi:MAG: TetR/AcrR family transcriptional regulator [Flavobacterium sp.]|mgnify:CR=1 FL=1|jgi:AcrR family transcriptional regulator|uniref:TetR/AcrR family transcriptional regulator n=1 Tax=unclassified Flavobacterium TaxID=196869 RepID=UPI000C1825BE|nr:MULTISPECIES: TetR/AcrR family transcriptional regulator [unclassified Flavobacterium]MBP6558309.1 TetR/AcrR family transcriptional regulator [Flavobacterium sp.]MDP3681773.1 TetR/AcrR family transcriptional regulator [Flavobacterium sp.]PIF61086.1 TetR family transcriptional regulator [Flavobacterium sp. 11]RKS12924.1 TetR family transcriptional regulator [Flavobacterium sp. 120]WKL45464.1 TetR/AcrR family transcriptional regulator [Flavobacterium sp. ZE23DGlu08]